MNFESAICLSCVPKAWADYRKALRTDGPVETQSMRRARLMAEEYERLRGAQ